MRMLLTLLVCGALRAQSQAPMSQIPANDARNTEIPNTDTHFTARTYKTLAEWQARRAHLRKQILSAAGLLPMPPKNDLHPQIFGRIENKTYSIEKVLLETMPGYYLGGNLYRPMKQAPAGGFPGIVSPHGHWTYGRLEHSVNASVPARCINLAQQGYVVFCYDMVGYNDTVQTPHDFGSPVEQLWDFGSLSLQLWNSIRAVDFLQSLPGVNAARIGATGASGGGTQTFLLTAVDDRIQFSAPVNMISAIMQGGGVCENAPNLRLDTFNVEIASMMAPRPMIMVSATGDWTKNNLTEEFPSVRSIYELFDQGANVEAMHQDAPHNYNQVAREAVYRFFGKHVLGETDAAKFKEHGIHLEKLQDMLALHNRTLPANALDYAGVFAQWVRTAQSLVGETTDRNQLREMMELALGAEWPERVVSEANGEKIVFGRPGRGDRVAGLWFHGEGRKVLFIHPDRVCRAGAHGAPNLHNRCIPNRRCRGAARSRCQDVPHLQPQRRRQPRSGHPHRTALAGRARYRTRRCGQSGGVVPVRRGAFASEGDPASRRIEFHRHRPGFRRTLLRSGHSTRGRTASGATVIRE